MAVSFVAVSNAAAQTAGVTTTAGTTAITPTLPAGTASGDRVFVFQSFATAATSAATPAGWTALYKDVQVGTGTAAAGGGLRRISCYYRDYDGVWTMPSFALTSTAQNTHAIVALTARKGATETWDTPTASSVGTDYGGTVNTAFSATTTAFTTIASALLIAHTAMNDPVSMTAGAITGTNGFTAGTVTERADGSLATGNDVAIQIHTCIPTAAASPAGTLTHTGTLSAASEGGVCFVQQTVSPPPPPGNGPQYASVGAGVSGATATLSIPVPSGVASGDTITVAIYHEDGTKTITPPAGFAAAPNSPQQITGASNLHALHVFVKTATGADSGTYAFTFSTAPTYGTGFAFRITGADTTNPFDVTDGQVKLTTTDGTTPAVSATTTVADTLLVWIATLFHVSAAPTLSGWAEFYDQNSGAGFAADWKAQATAGPTGSITNTFSTQTGASCAWLGAYKLPGGLPPIDQTDPVGATDALTKEVANTRNDPVGIVDALTKDAGRTPTDAVGITDSAVFGLGFNTTATDPVGATDSTAITRDWVRTDPVGLSDSLTVSRETTATDPVGATDSLVTGLGYSHSSTDPIGVTDQLSQELGRNPTDPVAVTDSVATNQDWDRAIADVVGISDSAEFTVTFAVEDSDPVGIADSLTTDVVQTVTDPVGITDSLATDTTRAFTDPVGITDVAQADQGFTREATDDIGGTDSLVAQADYGRDFSDPVAITDSSSFVVVEAGQISVTDLIGVTDAASVAADQVRDVTDPVEISDDNQIVTGREVLDSVDASDAVTFTADYDRDITDPVAVTDFAQFSTGGEVETTDPVHITDGAFTASDREFLDSVGVSDDLTFTIERDVLVTDSIGLSDSSDFSMAGDIDAADPVGVTDSLSMRIIIETAPSEERTLYVGAQDRTLHVKAEDRTLNVDGEDRTLHVEAEARSMAVEGEDRVLRVPAEARGTIV